VLDVDKMAKNIYLKTPGILKKLNNLFGDEIFSPGGDLIFKSLAERVFSRKTDLKKLNRLMFPLIRDEVKNILNKSQSRSYIIIDAAILLDCKLDLFCDCVILVDTSSQRRKTFLKNEGFSDNDVKLRMEGQHIKVNEMKVNFIINNCDSKRNLLVKVKKILKNI
jgi:dephospho-CoA kinase